MADTHRAWRWTAAARGSPLSNAPQCVAKSMGNQRIQVAASRLGNSFGDAQLTREQELWSARPGPRTRAYRLGRAGAASGPRAADLRAFARASADAYGERQRICERRIMARCADFSARDAGAHRTPPVEWVSRGSSPR